MPNLKPDVSKNKTTFRPESIFKDSLPAIYKQRESMLTVLQSGEPDLSYISRDRKLLPTDDFTSPNFGVLNM